MLRNWLNNLISRPTRSTRRSTLHVGALEERSLMSATALPVTPVYHSNLTDVDGTLFFAGYRSTSYYEDNLGWELYKSDGTEGGSVLVKNINAESWGDNGSNPAGLTEVNGTLFFTAADFIHGRELWKSDGTEAGTVLVKDVNPGLHPFFGGYASGPQELTNVNGTLYFTADDGNHGRELWKSNAAGTVLVKDIYPLGAASSNPEQLTNVNGTLYFSADNGIDGRELWKSNGTAAGTVMVKNISYGSATPQHLTNLNGTLFFTADNGPNGHGRELWKSNGTAAGTVRVKDIRPGIAGSQPTELTVMGSKIYFSADNGSHGRELWKSDGTAAGTVQVRDIAVGDNSSPLNLVAAGNTLYFAATDSSGRELWKSDGTAAGTFRVKDIYLGAGNSSPAELTVVEGQLYFTATGFDGRATHGRELWTSDGTEKGTQMVQDLFAGAGSSSPTDLAGVGGTLYFSTPDHSTGNWESANYTGEGWLWKAGQLPGIVAPGNQTHNEGASVSVGVSASTPGPLSFTVSGLPAGLTFNPKTRRIAGTIAQSAGANSPYTVTVTATHEWMTSSTTFTWIVRDVTPPVVVNPGNQFSNEGNTVSLAMTATDTGGDPLTYSAANLPTGLNIDPATGLISGTVGWQAAGTYSVTVSATDGQNVGSKTFAWTIADLTPPTIVNPGPQQHNEGNTIALTIGAADPEGDTLTFAATGLPPGLGIDNVSGLISGTIGGTAAGVYQAVVSVSDGTHTVSTTFAWAINAA
jgi:ELWxxDGT repeat protein